MLPPPVSPPFPPDLAPLPPPFPPPYPPGLAPVPPPYSPLGRCDVHPTIASEDGSFDTTAVLGVGLAALSALISTFALLIMKHSADVEKGLPLRPSCKHRWRKRWWIGFIMNTGSELGITTFALMFAPITVVAPVFGSAVIFSAIVARLGWVSKRIYRITQARTRIQPPPPCATSSGGASCPATDTERPWATLAPSSAALDRDSGPSF